MPQLRNIGADVDLFRPAGAAESLPVQHGQVVEVPGELTEPQPPDAYLIGSAGDARTWPHAQWELVEPSTTTDSAPPASPPAATDAAREKE